jgi:pantothenate kinase type III
VADHGTARSATKTPSTRCSVGGAVCPGPAAAMSAAGLQRRRLQRGGTERARSPYCLSVLLSPGRSRSPRSSGRCGSVSG